MVLCACTEEHGSCLLGSDSSNSFTKTIVSPTLNLSTYRFLRTLLFLCMHSGCRVSVSEIATSDNKR